MKLVNLKLLGAIVCLSTIISSYSQNNWTINGNGNTTGAANFLGTNNNEPLNIRTNSIQRIFIDNGAGVNSGFVAIGNNFAAPQFRLDVDGQINLTTSIFTPNTGYVYNGIPVLQVKNNGNLFLGHGAGVTPIVS